MLASKQGCERMRSVIFFERVPKGRYWLANRDARGCGLGCFRKGSERAILASKQGCERMRSVIFSKGFRKNDAG